MPRNGSDTSNELISGLYANHFYLVANIVTQLRSDGNTMFSTRASTSLRTNHYSPQPSVNNVIYSTCFARGVNTLLRFVTLYYTIYTVLHYNTLHYTTLHYTILYYTIYTVLHYNTLHYTALHYTILYYTIYTVLHYNTLHYTTLLYTILY